jgi:hypothetical protein
VEASVDVDSVLGSLHQADFACSFRIQAYGVSECSCIYRFLYQQK